ncbi:DUF3164 family protein [Candidatus Electronema sp. JM]|uniref:DUF3164 family protein n=1 Tax=Candidatus Electronema sp. JM TaxID=3401571 RepID=UPI003AA81986
MAVKDAKGNWIDPEGNHIPEKYVPAHERREDVLVMTAAESMLAISEAMQQAKSMIMLGIEQYLSELAAENGEDALNVGGNYTWRDFSGVYKVELRNAKIQQFDDRIKVAAQKLERVIDGWAMGAAGRDELKSLATEAFENDEQGRISPGKVFRLQKRLRGMTETTPEIAEVVRLISESVLVVGRKQYISLSRRAEDGSWETVPMDFARI